MKSSIFKTLQDKIIICIICLLAIVAALGGLGITSLYHDNIFVVSGWKGHDIVTLFICVPALFISLIYAQNDLLTAKMIGTGSVGYLAYTYALYSFTAAYNNFFLIYIALFSLSVFFLISVMFRQESNEIIEWENEKIYRNLITSALLLSTIFLLVNSVGMIAQAFRTDSVPDIILQTGLQTSPMFVLDLGFDIPITLFAMVQLLRKRYSGYLLTGIILTTKSISTLSLIASSVLAYSHAIKDVYDMLTIWIFLFLLSVASLILFMLKSPIKDNYFAPYYFKNMMNIY